MHVNVLFFGVLRDIVGRGGEEIQAPDGATLGDLFAHYATAFPRLKEMEASVKLARNLEFGRAETPVCDGDEIAFLPPVSGGTAGYLREISDERGCFFALTREVIHPGEIVARLLAGEDGAAVTFEGVVRNNTKGRPTRYLEYECYEPMAVKAMAQIGAEIAGSQAIGRIAMVHRLGRLEIGETSVVVAATAPHRRPAFEAALEGINRLKRVAPIWKKEYFEDGEVWVEGEWDESIRKNS